MTPVRTSPVPAVARAGLVVADDQHALAGRADQRVGPLQQDDAAEPLDRPPREPPAGARRPRRTSSPSSRPSSPECGVRTVSAAALERLEPIECVGVHDGRHVRLEQQPPNELALLLAAPEPGPERQRPRPPGGVECLLERALDRLQHQRLEHRQRVLRCGDGDVAGVGAKRGARGECRSARSCPERPPTTSTDPAVYLFWPSRSCAARGPGARRRRARARSAACSSPMSASDDLAARGSSPARPRARPSAPCIVTVRSRLAPPRPGTSPVEASTPDGMSTATTGAPAALIRADQLGRLGPAARRRSRSRTARRRRRRRRRGRSTPRRRDRPRAAGARRCGRRRRSLPCRRPPGSGCASGKRARTASATARAARSISVSTS